MIENQFSVSNEVQKQDKQNDSSQNSGSNSQNKSDQNRKNSNQLQLKQNFDQKVVLLAHRNDQKELKQLILRQIQKNIDIDLMKISDERSYTLIHISCLNNQYELLKFLIEIQQKQLENDNKNKQYGNNVQKSIEQWVNKINNLGFTALHLASFRGNYQIIELLKYYGADINCINYQGMNVLHMAAQGDQALSTVYFINSIDINQTDNKGSSPIHWAAYSRSEKAMKFMLKYPNINVNQIDKSQGMTALHLAIIGGSYKIVKGLLQYGADIEIKDKLGKNALETAIEFQNEVLIGLITESMKGRKEGRVARMCRMDGRIEKGKKKGSEKMLLYMFILIMTVNYLLLYVCIVPFVNDSLWIILNLVFTFLSILFFLLSWLTDPGYIKKSSNSCLLQLLKQHTPDSICAYCEVLKPKRSKHCEICNRCVLVFDHHCPWINNCIGTKNHFYFILFATSLWINILFILIFVTKHISDFDLNYFPIYFPNQAQSFSYTFYIKLFISIIIIIISTFFIFPISYLCVIQIQNLSLNKTTNERFGYISLQSTQNLPQQSQSPIDVQLKFSNQNSQLSDIAEDKQQILLNQNNFENKEFNSLNIEQQSQKKMSKINNCYMMCFGNQKQFRNI